VDSTRSTAPARCGDQLAKMLLAGDVHDGDVVPVNVSADGDGLVLG
jgi:ATP-dependent Clp protease ATP-binding subunit ClpB